jgi:hypothetical protein
MKTGRASIFHARDLEQLGGLRNLGGLTNGQRRFHNDPPPQQDWRGGLPEDMRGNASLGKFKSVGDLAKSYLEVEAFRGSSIRIPSADAGDDVKKEFHEKLRTSVPGLIPSSDQDAVRAAAGIPKEAKEYAFDAAALPEGVQFSAEEQERFRADALRFGVSKERFKELVKDAAERRAGDVKAVREAQAALKAEWGLAYEDRLAEVKAIVEKTNAPQHLKDAISQGRMDKATAAWLIGLAKGLGVEAREIAEQRDGSLRRPKLSPEEAEAKIGELFVAMSKAKDPAQKERYAREIAGLEQYASPDLARQARLED